MVSISALKLWPYLLGRGGVGVLLGLAMVIWPARSLIILVWLSALLVMATGVIALIGLVRSTDRLVWDLNRVLTAVLSGVAIVAGIAALVWQDATVQVVTVLLALWFVAEGLGAGYAGLRLRTQVTGEFVLIAVGVIAVGVGATLLVMQALPLATFMVVAGGYLIASGLAVAVDALQLRSFVLGARRVTLAGPMPELTGPIVEPPAKDAPPTSPGPTSPGPTSPGPVSPGHTPGPPPAGA